MVLRTRAPTFFNQTVAYGPPGGRTCTGGTVTEVLRISATTFVSWNVVDPLAPPASYPTGRTTETVLMESLAMPAQYAQSCGANGGSLVLRSDGWTNASSSFLLAPPPGCPDICNGQTLSLRQGTVSFANLASDGTVTLAARNASIATAYTDGSAALVASRQTVSGVTGWMFSTVTSFGSGMVLTASSTCASTDATCCTPGAGGLVLAPIPATGLSTAHLFRMFWADGSGDVTALPTVPNVATQPTCNFAPSSSPLPTVSPTGSNTPSISVTSTSSLTPGGTPTGTSECSRQVPFT